MAWSVGREESPPKGWFLDTPLPDKNYEVTAARSSTGMIYAFGRDQKLERFDPVTRTWSSGLWPSGGVMAVAAAPDGRIYATGNPLNQVTGTGPAAFEAYDPTTNSWESRAPIPMTRFDAAAVAGRDGKIYVLGGFVDDPADNSNRLYRRSIYVYNPKTNSWRQGAAMPTPREGLGAAAGADGTIYAIGGGTDRYDRFYKCFSAVEAYDPLTNSWSRRASLPTSMCDVTAGATSKGTIVAIGGATVAGGEQGAHITPATGAVLSFKTDLSSWKTVSRTPFPRKQAGAVIGPKGTIYVVGGADKFNHPTATVQKCTACING
jgi:N-acetylneuraminic acid mutarotase